MNRPPLRKVMPGETLPPEQPGRLSGEGAGILALLVLTLLITAGCLLYGRIWPAAAPADSERLSAELTAAIVDRGCRTAGLTQQNPVWAQRLADGRASLDDYLLRLIVSPEYLVRQQDDAAFLQDIEQIVTGSVLDGATIQAETAALNNLGSRIAYINDRLKRLGYAANLPTGGADTRLRTITVVNDRPAGGEEVVGILPVTSNARITGRAARLRLYADGKIRQELKIDTENPSLEHSYTLEWNTGAEAAGSHTLALLAICGDGRGRWIDLNTYTVPQITSLDIGRIMTDEKPADDSGTAWTSTRWYRLPPMENGQVMLNLFNAGTTIQARLYDAYARQLAETSCTADRTGALRYAPADQAGLPVSDTYYVRVDCSKPAEGSTAAHYSLAPSPAYASPSGRPEEWLAVLERKADQLLLQDQSGTRSWQNAADYTLYDPTACLSSILLTLPDGGTALSAPAFDAGTLQYGLYVDAGTDHLRLNAVAMEGSAAQVAVTNQTEKNGSRSLEAQGVLTLDPSVNNLNITVTGFDGSRRTYQVSILRSPDSKGFHTSLEQFPETYRSPLWLLHLKQPSYTFAAEQTGLDWQSFIDAEDEKDRSLVEADSSPAAWVEEESPVYDGSSWKAASRGLIAYFADPRNFLDEVNIFQFEHLTYEAGVQNHAGLSVILADSFMDPDKTDIDYAGLILDAGRNADISPYFLASKIIQEMGRQGQSPLSSGKLPGYEGVYNFYNIGATPDPSVENGAQINGARFALYGRDAAQGEITEDEAAWLLPWNTPERAIRGGAVWIAERYVRIGQDTLYSQKFDLAEDGGFFIHQYAQNIQMAWAEGRRTRQAYADLKLLDQSFVFRIPVFDNMPDTPAERP
ncbi:MAG: cadherin-like beta sandwich domain-containing protein [Clostridiaceae bacterium]|nr:cadherin-like beta sandwich domain-containing protein [Clostridiaceae bacterium]